MAQRSYRLGRRQISSEETRARIVSGARDLLMSADGFRHFTLDAIARRSGVTRMTVYNQLHSKTGIFDALADDLALRGGIAKNLAAAFTENDARVGLVRLIGAFVAFWSAEPEVMRKLHALTQLDPEFSALERHGRRREAIRSMLERLRRQHHRPSAKTLARSIDVIHTLTAFDVYDTFAQSGWSDRAISAQLVKLAETALELSREP